MDKLMPSPGANSPEVNLPQDNDASIPASSFQNSFTPINNTKSQRQRLPNPDMNVPAQVLPSSPADPQENQKPGLAYASGAYLSSSSAVSGSSDRALQ